MRVLKLVCPKTNAHVCTSLFLKMLFHVVEKAPCWLGESAVAAHREDDFFGSLIFCSCRCMREFQLLFNRILQCPKASTPQRSSCTPIRRRCQRNNGNVNDTEGSTRIVSNKNWFVYREKISKCQMGASSWKHREISELALWFSFNKEPQLISGLNKVIHTEKGETEVWGTPLTTVAHI